MKFVLTLALLICNYEVYSQIIRTPLGLINRPIADTIIETPRYINQAQIIAEQPCNIGNYPITVPNLPISNPNIPILRPNVPISVTNLPINQCECTPSVCKDLANTIQIMTVANLLQNTQSDKLAAKLANPILRQISNPILPCGCSNPIYNNQIQIAKIAPNSQPQKIIAREVIVGPNGVPNVILPNIGSPNSPKIYTPITEQIDGRVNSGVLKNILQYLGNGI